MSVQRLCAAAAIAAAAFASPVGAQQMKTVQGIVVNLGIVTAIAAEHADAQHGVHKGGHGPGVEHIVIALAEEKSGARIADAQVNIEVKNPKGAWQKKPLTAMSTGGFPDYSEVFDLGWSGKYVLRVLITRKGSPQPVEATFTVNRSL